MIDWGQQHDGGRNARSTRGTFRTTCAVDWYHVHVSRGDVGRRRKGDYRIPVRSQTAWEIFDGLSYVRRPRYVASYDPKWKNMKNISVLLTRLPFAGTVFPQPLFYGSRNWEWGRKNLVVSLGRFKFLKFSGKSVNNKVEVSSMRCVDTIVVQSENSIKKKPWGIRFWKTPSRFGRDRFVRNLKRLRPTNCVTFRIIDKRIESEKFVTAAGPENVL